MTDWWFREEWEGQVTKEQKEGREWNFLPAPHSFSSFSFLSFFQITQDSLFFSQHKAGRQRNNSWRFHLKTDEKRMTLKKERQRKGNKMRRTKNFWAGTDINPETDTKTITTLYTESEHERRRQKNDDDAVKKNRWNECSRSASNDLFPDLRAAFADSFYKKRGTLDWSSVRERESFAERIACLLPDPC